MGFFKKAGSIADKGIKKTKQFFDEVDENRKKSRSRSMESNKFRLKELRIQKQLAKEEFELERLKDKKRRMRKDDDGVFGNGDLFGRGGMF